MIFILLFYLLIYVFVYFHIIFSYVLLILSYIRNVYYYYYYDDHYHYYYYYYDYYYYYSNQLYQLYISSQYGVPLRISLLSSLTVYSFIISGISGVIGPKKGKS